MVHLIAVGVVQLEASRHVLDHLPRLRVPKVEPRRTRCPPL